MNYLIDNKYILEFISFINKEYPSFNEKASLKELNSILECFNPFFNEENKIKILKKRQELLDKGYIEVSFDNKEYINYVNIFYENKNLINNFYLDIEINNVDKNFILFKKSKKQIWNIGN